MSEKKLCETVSFKSVSLTLFSASIRIDFQRDCVFPKGDVGGTGCKGAGVMVGQTQLLGYSHHAERQVGLVVMATSPM